MFSRKRADTVKVDLPPPPVVLLPSGKYAGNDGKWSTFTINIAGNGAGTGQNFDVLVSTSWSLTLVPAQNGWCNATCSKLRGIPNVNSQQALGVDTTSNWIKEGVYDLTYPDWWSNDLMLSKPKNGSGEAWGRTNIGLGGASPQSITLPNQYVASVVSNNFFLGSLGLAVGAISASGAQRLPFLSTLAVPSINKIASNSYGYTAGAVYRNNHLGVPGSMIFGGYDKARFNDQGTSIPMPNQRNNTLIVGVQSILYAPDQDVQAKTVSFTQTGFSAIIDSTLPYLVLPNDICDQFATNFNLEFDRDKGMYTVNDTAHERNVQQNATVSFKIGSGPTNSANSTTIDLPYAAFDLQASFPIYESATNYFPLKRSSNGRYILGRTFLQEAYLIVDYERANFTVAPAYFSEPMPSEKLVSIWNTTYVPPSGPAKSGDDGMSAGAIAGIVVGIVALFLLAGLGAFFFWRRRRNAKAKALQEEEKPSEIDTIAAGGEVKNRRVSELTGSEPPYSPTYKPAGTYYGSDNKHIGPISEMSPDSPPAELYSPPPGGINEGDYFASAPRPRRRGATRNSSGNNTPGTTIAELPGDYGRYPVTGQQTEGTNPLQRPKHSRGPSDTSLSTNIDEVLAAPEKDTAQIQRKLSRKSVEHTGEHAGLSRAEQVVSPLDDTRVGPTTAEQQASIERRPSHARGLSDTTVNSDSTAVSQPTPDELERWALSMDDGPRRALSQ